MIILKKPSFPRCWWLVLAATFLVYGCATPTVEPSVSEPILAPTDLFGEWCREKKRMITHYSVKKGKLFIRGGRSGRTYEADLTCNDAFTECEAKTIRGWGTPVTEILRLDGHEMDLTRIWGGAWKDKTYNFSFTRCPKL
ncbi:MAG: hypothetical protein ABW158_22335 [Candidatus Thiodiazotropha sp. 6PDIVS]